MSKKTMRIITILVTILAIVMVGVTSFAAEISINTIDGKGNVDVTQIGTVGNKIATILRAIGTVLLVVVLMVLGIKYMMGSAEEKAEYKKTMIPYLVGAILVFGATQIAGAVLNFAK
ncbi:MAG: TrbC/VirB2 family protein [Clostridia bacterium]|nr:TrbC/VirB2 family protein [Clostridia bacterium]